jgi:NADH-quinone oxidoreductase subunit N
MEISIPPFDLSVIAPEIVLLITAVLVMMVDLFLDREQKRRLAWLSLVGVVAAAILSYYVWSDKDQTLHDMLAADGYALFLNLVILSAAGLAILISVEYTARIGLAQGEYYSLLLFSTTGMMLMAAAINLVTLFLGLELLSIALYVLVGLNRAERRSGEAALKYLLLGAFSSAFLLYGVALIYGQTGTTSLAGVRQHLTSGGVYSPTLAVGLGLLLIGFGFKVTLVPFQMWTPDVYQGAPTSVTAFMSVGAKAAGFGALGRVTLYAFGGLQGGWTWLLAVLALLTMTVGNLVALRQTNLKRMLAYSSIAHAGYILVGLTASSELGGSAVLFYLLAYTCMNMVAFSMLIAVGRLRGEDGRGDHLEDLVGLAARRPSLAAAMSLSMLSLAGVPPLAGFLGKLYLFGAAVQAGLMWLAVCGVLNSVVSAYYYLRVVAAMYMQESAAPDEVGPSRICPAFQVGVGLASMAIIILGVWPVPIVDLARLATAVLMGG